ncbi:hypothetical protein R1flu_011150 [Riccia fluitans]|uniref:Uncharacterized protein n=1 Tax=Riccia fluitans TaxID=41844 RepID=A0ABD1Z7Z2_9MARC
MNERAAGLQLSRRCLLDWRRSRKILDTFCCLKVLLLLVYLLQVTWELAEDLTPGQPSNSGRNELQMQISGNLLEILITVCRPPHWSLQAAPTAVQKKRNLAAPL